MSRYRAALIHFCISLVIGALVLGTIYFVIYPPPLFKAMGGSELAVLVIAVDMVLGPLLTLVVFRAGKRELKFDLGVIAVLQLTALGFGIHVVWEARPVFILARADVAYVVSAVEIDPADLQQASLPQFQTFSWTGPTLGSLQVPKDGPDRQWLMDAFLNTGKDAQHFPRFYQPWMAGTADRAPHLTALADLRHRKPQHAAAIDDWLQRHARGIEQVKYLSLLTLHAELVLAVDAETGDYLGIIDVDAS